MGKSTLVNHLTGQKIAITSRKPQTTRNKIQCIYTSGQGQIIFQDTPGIHIAKNKLGEYMVRSAEGALRDSDVAVWLVEPQSRISGGEKHIAGLLSKRLERYEAAADVQIATDGRRTAEIAEEICALL